MKILLGSEIPHLANISSITCGKSGVYEEHLISSAVCGLAMQPWRFLESAITDKETMAISIRS